MTYQTQSDVRVAYAAQAAKGQPAPIAGATVLRPTGGALKLGKKVIASDEVRQDGMRTRGRHSLKGVTGSYPAELSFGSFDAILAATLRGSWAAGVALTENAAAMGNATLVVTANAITASAGSWITGGLRVGDVLTFTQGLAAADLGRPLRVTGLTDTVITVADTLTPVAGPVAAWAGGVKGRKVINPAAGGLIKTYYTVEEYEIDTGASELFSDCLFGKLDIGLKANGNITITTGLTGTGAFQALAAGTAPYFTAPATTTSVPLSAIDAVAHIGSDLIDMSTMTLSIDLGLTPYEPAGATVSTDVFWGQMSVSGSLTVLRQDLARVADFLNEAQQSLHVLATVPGSAPADFISLYVPNFTFSDVNKSEISKNAGPRTQTLQFSADTTGIDARGGAFDPCMVKFQVSQ